MTSLLPKTRFYDLDWLRIFSIVAVFLFHSARAFDNGGWHIKSAHPDPVLNFWTSFLDVWIMPVLFFVSGASIALSLRTRSAGQFSRERVTRLLIPLVFGVLVLAPPQVYIERITRYQFVGSFIEFYPRYFSGLYLGVGGPGNFAWMGLHLWYLLVLFLFSFLLLPLFLLLRRDAVKARLARLGRWFENPVGLVALALPIMALAALLDPRGIGLRDFGGWNLFVYAVFVIYGFVMIEGLRFEAFYRYRWLMLAVAVAAAAVTLQYQYAPYGSRFYPVAQAALGLCSWAFVAFLLGMFYPLRSYKTPLMSWLSEMVMPFYMLHQTVIVIADYFILRTNFAPGIQYGLVLLTCLPLIVALCEFVVMRVNVLRFLFGLKPLPPSPQQVARRAHG